MSNKPIIGIVGRAEVSNEEYNLIGCYESIRRCIIKKGAIPILILPNQDIDYETSLPKEMEKLTSEEKEDLVTILKLCDGILMPGSYKLFEYDKFIYQYALDNDIPVLGICGGMQLMGLVDNSSSNDVLVRNGTNIDHFKKGEKYVHSVDIISDTLLYNILNKTTIEVNSRHNYHLTNVEKLKICAYSLDGYIEAVEIPNKKFILGVEWHPETMLEYDENSNKIIDAFISACK